LASNDLVLVTGASGFVAKHAIKAALAHGFRVRGSLRRPAVEAEVRKAVGEPGDRLAFATADLLSDAGWAAAVAGCRYVLHVASPFPLVSPKDRMALVPVARDGALRVVKAAADAGVERTVMTSSCVAVWSGQKPDANRVFTEADWSDVDSPHTHGYALSKTLAERAAWDFVAGQTRMTFATINPPFIMGPALDHDVEASGQTILNFLRGRYPLIPNYGIEMVDVRDVAEAHVRALERPSAAGHRLIGSGGPMHFADIGPLLAREFPAFKRKMPKAILPDFLARLAAMFDPGVRSIAPDIGPIKRVSTKTAREILEMTFRPAEEAVVAMARSLIELKLV